jgi:hypothetical protein
VCSRIRIIIAQLGDDVGVLDAGYFAREQDYTRRSG